MHVEWERRHPGWRAVEGIALASGDRELFEASPFDRVWGIGVKASIAQSGQNSRKTWGQNLLGLSLMKTRDELRRREDGSVNVPEP